MENYEILKPATETYVNPLYRDVVSEEDLKEPDSFDVSPMAEEAEYLSVEEAVIFMRNQMKQRVVDSRYL